MVDWRFAEQCVAEFDGADKKGFAFRYKGHGGERAHVSMERLAATMEHIYQVLDGILTLLIEKRGEIEDWLWELRSQAGW